MTGRTSRARSRRGRRGFGRAVIRCAVVCAALLIATVHAAVPGHARTLTVAALEGWAPFSDSSLPDHGFSNALTRIVLERAGYEVEIRSLSWGRALEMTRQGRYDILTSVWYRERHKEHLAYTDPIAVNEIAFVKRAGDPFEFSGLDDLEGKRVGIVHEYGYPEDFMRADTFQRDAVYTIVQNLEKLHAGRIDLTLGDRLTVRYMLTAHAPELADDLAFTEGALSRETLHVTVSKAVEDHEQIVADFDAALAEVRADGTYEALMAEYGID